MRKKQILGVRWSADRRARWEELARTAFKQKAATLARQVLEEYMACYLSRDELLNKGLVKLAVERPGGLICHAVLSGGKIDEQSSVLSVVGPVQAQNAKSRLYIVATPGQRRRAE